jgi:hypothetical protein
VTVIDSTRTKAKAKKDLSLCKYFLNNAECPEAIKRWEHMKRILEERLGCDRYEPTAREITELVQYLANLAPVLQSMDFQTFTTKEVFDQLAPVNINFTEPRCTLDYDPPCGKIDFMLSHYHKIYMLRLDARTPQERELAKRKIIAYVKRLNTVWRAKL